METITIEQILKEKFVGKELKFCVASEPVTQDILVYKKKSKNVTDKQFEGGNPKFRMKSFVSKNIGRNIRYDTKEIIDVKVDVIYGYETSYDLLFILDSDKEIKFGFDAEFVCVDENVIMNIW